MAITITDYLKIDKDKFDELGAFDSFLDINSKLFVSPMLLKRTSNEFFIGSYEEIRNQFTVILKLLKISKSKGDRYWKQAVKMLVSKEQKGISLGYAKTSDKGSGISYEISENIISVAKEFVDIEKDFPEIFEIMCIFEKGIGSDRISDIILSNIKEKIYKYSEYIFSHFDINKKKIKFNENTYDLPFNEYNNEPILVIDRKLLLDLPVAEDFSDIDYVSSFNEKVRQEFSSYLNISDRKKKLEKEEIKRLFIGNDKFFNSFLEKYREDDVMPYDFEKDKNGEIKWYYTSKKCVAENPIKLEKTEDVYELTKKICYQFKYLIEEKGLWKSLYDDNGISLNENHSQMLFFGIADSYCKANDIDISRENNNGNGPVDFKLSKGYYNKIVVEIKKSSNSQLSHCYEVQIPIYMKQEEVEKAIYLFIDLGDHDIRVKNFKNEMNKYKNTKIELIEIDGREKESASKRIET